MSEITFYQDPISQPCRAVLALLHLGNIKFDEKIVNLFKRENRLPEYLAVNPFGTLPTLVHKKLALGESNAILTYLCEAFPNELGKYAGSNI
jgi:glutathione S-transferase